MGDVKGLTLGNRRLVQHKECKRSPSRDRKTFVALGNVKKNFVGGGKNVPLLTSGLFHLC